MCDLETLLTSAEQLLYGLCILLSTILNHHTRSGSYNDPRGGAVFDPRIMIVRIYVELHITITMLHIKYTSFVPCSCREEEFFMYFHYKSLVDNDMPGACPIWTPRGTVGRIYKEKYTKYESSGPCGLGEDFFMFFPIVSLWELLTPLGGTIFDPRGMIRRIYVKLQITILYTKYRSFCFCSFRKEDKYFPL